MAFYKYIEINNEDKARTQTKNVIRCKFFLFGYLYRYMVVIFI